MLLHIVLFWLKKNLSEEELTTFENEVISLENISSVEQLHVGKPATTPNRPVIDDSYDFCLTVMLRDISAHDTYQNDPLHLNFIKNCSHMWEKVKIYDAM
jgi:hypothetical protein